jgi:hypothetical protein
MHSVKTAVGSGIICSVFFMDLVIAHIGMVVLKLATTATSFHIPSNTSLITPPIRLVYLKNNGEVYSGKHALIIIIP